jgi:tRNA(fMet)-specific endonuclease VapC
MAPRYILDTDICIHVRRRRSPALLEKFNSLERGEAVLSVITYGELLYGARKSSDSKRAVQIIEEFASLFDIALVTAETAKIYGVLRADLASTGQLIGSNDLWIAAQAKLADLTLVTGNEREFRRIAGLKIENWVIM